MVEIKKEKVEISTEEENEEVRIYEYCPEWDM